MSDHDLPPSAPASTRTPSLRRLAALAGAVGVVAGLAAVYGMGGFDGNANDGGKCPGSAERAATLKPLAVGEVAAFAPAARPHDLSALPFTDADGRPATLAAFSGRVVLLNLWATWCGPCRREMPALDRLQQNRGNADFEVVAVNLDTRDPEKPKTFLAETGVKALAFRSDASFAFFRSLQSLGLARGLPTTILLDRRGCELGVMAGPAAWDGPEAVALIDGATK